MKRFFLTLMLTAMLTGVGMRVGLALAQAPAFSPGLPESDTNPAPRKSMCWNGSAWVNCGTGGTAIDPNNASYTFGASSSASNNTFVTAGRGLDALCTVAGTVTLTDTAGGSRSVQLAVGYQYFPFTVKSYASLTGTCTLGVLL